MSYKTDRLAALFPDAYAARDRESVLYKLLDAVGAELMVADEKVKRLLKSHWVRYAEGGALDQLGAAFGVRRRVLRREPGETEERLESDEEFRERLQWIVPLFTGGGTRRAVIGAVRTALGLPFDFDLLNLKEDYPALLADLEALVVLTEFSPQGDRVLAADPKPTGDGTARELTLRVETHSADARYPRVEWAFDRGAGRRLSIELMGTPRGVKSGDDLIVGEGQTLVLDAGPEGQLNAFVGARDVSGLFTNLDGTRPALLPPVPQAPSEWRFRAEGGRFGDDSRALSRFDADSFDAPTFHVALTRLRLMPLTFDVEVPYYVEDVVPQLLARHNYRGQPFVFKGIPLEHIQDVVDQTRAAGVRGSVHFSLGFLEDHSVEDEARGLGCGEAGRVAGLCAQAVYRSAEDHPASDSLLVANVSQQTESQGMDESLTLAGVFDISTFEGPFGFM
ncbi:MAG TPA: hypothetical protein VN282_11835 [Pyrinomonadaceae bacterium]|nr:hypothetical protein [Pyrinomonadaceae bacterium]